MSALVQAPLWILLAALALALAYQGRIALHGLRVRLAWPPADDLDFGVLVPAHNEEAVIGALLDSLRRSRYPASRLHVLVVADHCTDATARLVREAGYACLERQAGERGKAPSLVDGVAWMQAHHPRAAALAFFDADNVVDPDFFSVMAGAVPHEPCLQGFTGVHNWNATVFTRLNFINAMVENRFRELGRSQAGLSCHLRGHGMVFRREVVQELQWQAGGMVEDYDMQLRLVLAGYRVKWLNEARVRSVLPETARGAAVQRRRWAGGTATVRKLRLGMLWRAWRTRRNPAVFDQMALLVIPSHAVQLCMALGVAALALLVFLAGGGEAPLWAAATVLALYLAYFLAGALLNGVRLVTLLSLPAAPFYILWRTWIFLTSQRGATRWR